METTDEITRTFVLNSIKSAKVVVFSKSYCCYCKKAKEILASYKIPPEQFSVIELEKNPDCVYIQRHLFRITGASTVPRIFINERCIGGCSELERLHSGGELTKLLAE